MGELDPAAPRVRHREAFVPDQRERRIGRGRRERDQPLADNLPEAMEKGGRIIFQAGEHLPGCDGRPAFADPAGLEHLDGEAGLAEAQRRVQPEHAGTHDDDVGGRADRLPAGQGPRSDLVVAVALGPSARCGENLQIEAVLFVEVPVDVEGEAG
jgi:hypothetical protein